LAIFAVYMDHVMWNFGSISNECSPYVTQVVHRWILMVVSSNVNISQLQYTILGGVTFRKSGAQWSGVSGLLRLVNLNIVWSLGPRCCIYRSQGLNVWHDIWTRVAGGNLRSTSSCVTATRASAILGMALGLTMAPTMASEMRS
jgi:hypothetical protein